MTDQSVRILERSTIEANAAAPSAVREAYTYRRHTKVTPKILTLRRALRRAENDEIPRESTRRAKPLRIMKETFCSKLRELWAIRGRCQQIKRQQRQNRLPRSNEFYGGTQRFFKITLRKTRPLGWTERAILIGNVGVRTSLTGLHCLLHRSDLAISGKLRSAISGETIRRMPESSGGEHSDSGRSLRWNKNVTKT